VRESAHGEVVVERPDLLLLYAEDLALGAEPLRDEGRVQVQDLVRELEQLGALRIREGYLCQTRWMRTLKDRTDLYGDACSSRPPSR
jgi:hypothetical protein